MRLKLENFRTKLDKCPKCGCKSIYVDGAITFDGYFRINFECNNPDCSAKFEFRGGWLKVVD